MKNTFMSVKTEGFDIHNDEIYRSTVSYIRVNIT